MERTAAGYELTAPDHPAANVVWLRLPPSRSYSSFHSVFDLVAKSQPGEPTVLTIAFGHFATLWFSELCTLAIWPDRREACLTETLSYREPYELRQTRDLVPRRQIDSLRAGADGNEVVVQHLRGEVLLSFNRAQAVVVSDLLPVRGSLALGMMPGTRLLCRRLEILAPR